MKPTQTGGGWKAILYTLRMAHRVGWRRLWRAMRARNACKTCALGMGGQAGGMRNEAGHWPEVCKKSLQAMVADMQKGLTPEFFRTYSIAQLRTLTPRELEWCGRLVSPLYAGPGDTHYRVISWDEALDRVASARSPARRPLLLRLGPLVHRGRLPAAAVRPPLRHQLRQQLLLLLPPGVGRRPRPGRRQRHRHRLARRRREDRPLRPHRRQ